MGLEEPKAKYQQVADLLREAIKRGEHPAGSMLPSQPELAKTYGLNQSSISRAFAVLQAEGLVRVERGKGAFVQYVPTVKRVRRIDRDYRSKPDSSSFADEMRKAGLTSRTELVELNEIDPPAEIAERFGLNEGEQAVIRRRHMFVEEEPVQIGISYIPIRYAGSKDLALPDTGPSGIYKRLAERGFAPVRFTEDIEVRRATPDEAQTLKIPKSQMVFEVVRSAIDNDDRPIEVCVNIFSIDQWRLSYGWRQEP